jgi:error-prone DNA polymerase
MRSSFSLSRYLARPPGLYTPSVASASIWALLRLALARLASMRLGAWIRLPGLVLIRQQPGTARGVVVVTVEDEHGQANIVIYAQVGERDRAALVGARLLVVEGRLEWQTEHAEVPITPVIARRLVDRTNLLQHLRDTPGGTAQAARGLEMDRGQS